MAKTKTAPASAKRSTKTKTAKTSATKKPAPKKVSKKTTPKKSNEKAPEEAEATIDRRRGEQRAGEEAGETPKLERRKKVNRRRQIDPTTCERDYSDDEVEFMNALDEYKRTSGRMFPTCSEVLEVIRDLGYAKLTSAELAARQPVEVELTDEAELTGELAAEQAVAEAAELSDEVRVG